MENVQTCSQRSPEREWKFPDKKTVEELKAHMEKANVAQGHYRACMAKAKDTIAEQQSSELQVPACEHFTFDFVQQAHIPHRK